MTKIADRVDLVGWDRTAYLLAYMPMVVTYALKQFGENVSHVTLEDAALDTLFELADKFPAWCDDKAVEPTGALFWSFLQRNINQKGWKQLRHRMQSLESLTTDEEGDEAMFGRVLLASNDMDRLRRPSDLHRDVCDAIAVMPLRWKLLLALRFHEEMALADVAEIVGQGRSAAGVMLGMVNRRVLEEALSRTLDNPDPVEPIRTNPWEIPFGAHRWVWRNTKWPDVHTYLGMVQRDYENDVSYILDMIWSAQGVAVLHGARGQQRPERHADCGTESAYQRHKRWDEPIDEQCELAHDVYLVEKRARIDEVAAARARGEEVIDRRRRAA